MKNKIQIMEYIRQKENELVDPLLQQEVLKVNPNWDKHYIQDQYRMYELQIKEIESALYTAYWILDDLEKYNRIHRK